MDFQKNANIKFHKNRSRGGHFLPCRRQTDGQVTTYVESNSFFNKFYERALKMLNAEVLSVRL